MSNKSFEGIIERLFVNDRKTAKGDKKSISIANNKIYYGLGLHDKETYEVDCVTLKEGMTVSFEYSDGKYKNVVLDTLKIVQQEVTKEVKKAKNDKDLAIRLGNAVTIATHLTKSKLDIVDVAKRVVPMVDELREKLANKHTEMDTYSLGARLGQAAIIAAQYTANIDDFIGFAEDLFEQICQAEGELKNSPVKQEVKTVDNTTKGVMNNLTQNIEQQGISTVHNEPPVVAWDEDIPFSPIGLQYRSLLNTM